MALPLNAHTDSVRNDRCTILRIWEAAKQTLAIYNSASSRKSTASAFTEYSVDPRNGRHMGCDDSDGPGHAPRYLDVRPMKIRIIIALSIVSLISIVYLLGFPILYRHYPRRKVSFTYDDTPIKVCLEDVVKQAGIEKIVYESTIDENSVITLRGRQMRGPNALHWISEIAELQIRYDGKYLHVGNTVQAGSDSNEFNNESFQKVYGDFDWYIFNKFGFHLY